MRIFVAGATGVVGRRLVPLLVEAGYEVTGMTRRTERVAGLERQGARGAVVDVFDRQRLHAVLAAARPKIVVHELTDLPRAIDPRKLEEQVGPTDRIRTEGTRNLIDAARAAGARRVVAQSYLSVYAPQGAMIKTEDEPLDVAPGTPRARRGLAVAVQELERPVTGTAGMEGVALRYGALYGPDTVYDRDGAVAQALRARRYPIVGNGSGVSSFVHVDDAVAATVLALSGAPGVYNVCDDVPAPVSDWLPFYARTIGAPPPRRLTPFLARILAGEFVVYFSTQMRGGSNAKARRTLGFRPHFADWHDGFRATLGQAARAA